MKKLANRDLLVPALLVALSIVPMLGGAVRLASLSGPPTPESARFVAAPVPVVLHIVGAGLYALLGAFQFSSAVRRRWPRWHRRAGESEGPTRDALMVLAWAINAAVAEWAIQRRRSPVRPSPSPA